MGPIAAFLASVVLPTLVTVALIVMGASTPGEFFIVRASIALAGFDLFGLTIWVLYKHGGSFWHFVIGAAILSFLGVGLPIVFQWVDERERMAALKTAKPKKRKRN